MSRPLRACCYPTPCDSHDRKPFATAKASSTLYATPRWKRERAAQLLREPQCRHCGAPARVVDHEPPHRGDEAAFWDRSRFRSLCWAASNSKTGREVRARVAAGRNERRSDQQKGCAPLLTRVQHQVSPRRPPA